MKRLALLLVLLVFVSCSTLKPESIDPQSPGPVLTVMTYNIHTGKGINGVFSLQRIADVIQKKNTQLAGIQEVDRFTSRNPVDEPAVLEEISGMETIFSKNLDFQGGEYGIAVMSRFPVLEFKSLHYEELEDREPRGALAVKVRPERMNRHVWFVTTHLGTDSTGEEQLSQARELLEWADELAESGAVILSGDFNCEPDTETVNFIKEKYTDVWDKAGSDEGYTFDARVPQKRIDYLFVLKRDFADCLSAEVPVTYASDHRPLVAEIRLWQTKN